jgi:hypothetical protein
MTYMMPLADGEKPCEDCDLMRGQMYCTMNCSPRKWVHDNPKQEDKMAGSLTLERIIRDPDDAKGSAVREWHISSEGSLILLRRHKGSNSFITLTEEDFGQLHADLKAMASVIPQMEKEDG